MTLKARYKSESNPVVATPEGDRKVVISELHTYYPVVNDFGGEGAIAHGLR
jgi:hypothetical protein